MKKLFLSATSLLFGISFLLISTGARATEVCSCNDFHDYLNGITQPMYGVSGTVVTSGFDFRNFCPEGNGSDKVVFIWTVDGTTVQTSQGTPVANAVTSLTHDLVYSGTYRICLTIQYSYLIYSGPEPTVKQCSKELCFEVTVEGPAYEPCEADASFTGTVSGSAINLNSQSSSTGSGIVISKSWTVDGYNQSKEFSYSGNSVRHIVSSNYASTFEYPIEVCHEVMVINELTGECCTDTQCETFMVVPTAEECSMDPDFSFSCFVNDCIYQFNGSAGSSTRNVKAWYWDFGDGRTSTEQRPIHMYSSPGQYEVCLTIVGYDEFGNDCCHETYCRTLNFSCTGVDLAQTPCDVGPGNPDPEPGLQKHDESQPLHAPSRLKKETGMEIAPNPAKETTMVTLSIEEENAQVDLLLLDITGKVKRTYLQNNAFQKGSNKVEIDCGGLAKGTYLLQLRSNGKVKTETIIIH
jgi:hypothetical protein